MEIEFFLEHGFIRWHKAFSAGQGSLQDYPHSKQPLTSRNEKYVTETFNKLTQTYGDQVLSKE